MATIVLQAAGGFLGGALGSVGAAIGSAAGAMAGYVIDRALIQGTQRYEGPRLSAARAFTAEEGASLPRVYGTMRIGGTIIWATRFEEESTTNRQGKLGPKVTTYSYFANVAFALCEGEIAGVRRIWADGQEIDRERVEIRIYRGSEHQPIDPLVEAKQGEGNAPAYRGTAYAVIEHFPIDDYGRRIPQFQFEVMRPVGELNNRIRSICLIPGSTEYGLAPELIKKTITPGETQAVNRHIRFGASDLEASLDELQALCPRLKTISLVTTWFGTDLRAGNCKIRPMVAEEAPEEGKLGYSRAWYVSGLTRSDAAVVSQVGGKSSYGGTPTDKSVMDAIRAIRRRGFKVALYPFIMMDVPGGNGLPDPYGGATQVPYPWRGRITCHPAPGMAETPDKTEAARAQVEALAGTAQPDQFERGEDTIRFIGGAEEWSYRRFLLHYAHLAAAAGGVEMFLLGSELRGLTTIRDAEGRFPFVELLQELASQARTILGSSTTITYGADWSEYFGWQPGDGTGDVLFHLDSLWAHPDINAVGIDNYMPLADWRDRDYGGENPDGLVSPYDLDGMRAAITSGEGFDWYYASADDRAARLRQPISDGAYGKHWVFRYKDLIGWWSNPHFERLGGIERDVPTAWIPQSKPIYFTELGCGAVDKGPNQPNVFPDPKSAENAVPYFSNGGRSDLAQYRLLLAHYRHWEDEGPATNPVSSVYGGPMVDVDEISVWAWDARPFPAFPLQKDVWGDGDNWLRGHWLNGRLSGAPVGALIDRILADNGLPPADTRYVDGVVSGYLVADPTTARAAIEPLARLFRINACNGDDGLVFASEGLGAGSAIVLDDLVLQDEAPVVERRRDPDHSLPALMHLDFRDQLNDHQSATAAAGYLDAQANDTRFLSFPGVISSSEANGLVRDLLRNAWDGREQVSFAVPANEQRPAPGGVIRLPDAADGHEYLVQEIEDGLSRQVRARRISRIAPAPRHGEVPSLGGSSGSLFVGQPHALFLDLPLRTKDDAPQDQLRVAARAKPWHRQLILTSPEETGFERRSILSRKAVIGELGEPLPPGSAVGRRDWSSRLSVKLYDGELKSVSPAQLFNGANVAAVKSRIGVWEIFQFETAEEIEPSWWHLRGLLRGQLGTEDATMAGAEQGGPLVLLDEAVAPAGLKAEEIGLELNWRVGPAGYDLSRENASVTRAVGGLRALTPLAPVHLKGSVRPDGLALFWVRRARFDADSWLGEEIPLGEEQELYRVDVAPPGGSVVRSASSDAPQWTYTTDMAIADFGTPRVSVDVIVRQVSAAVGPGLPVRGRFTLT